jgi:hypothetical protein
MSTETNDTAATKDPFCQIIGEAESLMYGEDREDVDHAVGDYYCSPKYPNVSEEEWDEMVQALVALIQQERSESE